MMPLSQIRALLACEAIEIDGQVDPPILFGCASDLMSDVLAFSRAGAVLLTGLVNVQTVQTAFIAEMGAIVFVRGKHPGTDVIKAARERKIPLLATPYSMYEACGLLYSKGLISTMEPAVAGMPRRQP